MHIEIHGLALAAHGMSLIDLDVLFDDHLKISRESYVTGEFGNTRIFKYSPNKSGEMVYISYFSDIESPRSKLRGIDPAEIKESSLKLNLHGSFFDDNDFRLRKFLKFISTFNPTFKQLDIAFNDDKKCLKKKELIHWSKDSGYYCKGDLVKRQVPYNVYGNRKLVRIQLGSARSKSNFGTIYKRPDTKYWRIEIKLKHNDKIKYVLENYSDKKRQQFEDRSLETLVKCINFVTPGSKKKSNPRKQPSWQSFLKSDVKKINWSKIYKERAIRCELSEKELFDKRIKRIKKMKDNITGKYSESYSEDEINKMLAATNDGNLDNPGVFDANDDIFGV